MKKTILNIAAVALSFTLIFTSCNKDKDAQPEEVAVQDNNTGMSESDDIVSISEDFMAMNTANMRISGEAQTVAGPCDATAEITKNADSSGGVIVIDFGAGKTCNDGRTRKGKIIITYTGAYRSNGSTQVITFDNYYVNDNKVEGKKTLTNTVVGSANTIKYVTNIKAEGFKITFKDGSSTEWASERIRTYDPKGTVMAADDEVTVTGSVTGKNRRGIAYTASITTALMLKLSCVSTSGWVPTSGIIKVTPADDFAERIVDYGTGSCDRTVMVTVNGNSRTVTVK